MKLKPVRDMKVRGSLTLRELIEQFKSCGGFVARELAKGEEILERMFRDNCTRFLSFPACVIATGLRGVIKDAIKKKLFDVVITTCGTLDHDLARIWKNYYHGTFFADDRELAKRGIHRLGNVFVPKESYGVILEKKLQKMLPRIYRRVKGKDISTCELIWEIGKEIANEKKAEESIIYWCWRNKIPVFVPGITDGCVGTQLWIFWQDHKDFKLNVLRDEQMLSDIVFTSRKLGALVIGGGISKHHVIWWSQFIGGLDYAVYVTTAVEYDGSLSGAQTREAISWNQIRNKAKHVTIYGDATVLVPLLLAKFL